MELTILHLFPDQMSLYGDYANLAVLGRHLETLGVTVTVKKESGDSPIDCTGAGLIYLGSGTERSQKAALPRLTEAKASMEAAMAAGAQLLFTGNAMETLGKTITDAAGKAYEGLGFASFTTVEGEKRLVGDVIARSEHLRGEAVGFANKCSLTKGVETPLFSSLLMGFGNEAEKGPEGYLAENILASHLAGPLLVKNPELMDLLITRIFKAQGWALPASLPRLPHEEEAYENTLRCLRERLEK